MNQRLNSTREAKNPAPWGDSSASFGDTSENREIFLFLMLVLILAAVDLSPAAQGIPFNYEPDKLEPGTMYRYELFTSENASRPARKLFYYIKSSENKATTIKVLNIEFYDQGTATYLNTYEMNWKRMMLESASWQYIGNEANLPVGDVLRMDSRFDFERKSVNWNSKALAEEGFDRKSVSTKFQIPTFFYFSNHVDGWTAMRFYPYPKNSIKVHISTSFHVNRAKIQHRGKKKVEVPAGEILCHKFEMKGTGMLAWLFGKKAWLWMSAEDDRNYMVRYKNNNEWGHMAMMDLRLTGVKKISPEEWREKIDKWSAK